MFVQARALCQKQAVKKQPLVAVTWQHAYTLCGECEAVSCFQINLCDPTSLLLTRFGIDNLFSLPEGVKLALKGEHYSDSSDIQHDVTKLLKRASLQDFQHAFEDLYKGSQHCVELGEGGNCIASL